MLSNPILKIVTMLVMVIVFISGLHAQDCFTIFQTENLNSYDAGKSFANWFVDRNFQNHSEFDLACAQLGADTKPLRSIHQIDDPEAWFETFQGEMNYYHELDSMFWKKVGDAVLHCKISVELKLKERVAEQGYHAWVIYGPVRREYDLAFNAVLPQGQQKVKCHISGNATAKGGFVNKKGKYIKVQPDARPIMTHLTRLDENEVNIDFIAGKETLPWHVVLPKQKKPVPFIRKFYLSEAVIVEGRHSAITWEVYGVEQVNMNHTIGAKPSKGQVIVAPEATAAYEIHAKNEQGEVVEKLQLNVERIYVKGIDITFYCGNKKDGKKNDQVVHIRVLNDQGELMAEGIYGEKIEFVSDKQDGSYYGPFHPDLLYATLKKQLLHGKFEFTLEGKSTDHWEFSPLMIIHYTDGTKNSFFGYENQELNTGQAPLEFKF
ncbi:MAG: hypothetical protein K1X54_10870 [Flavobacteriales bacterium]|nr:hypothetical protein [Flavobacteriales bacterium]